MDEIIAGDGLCLEMRGAFGVSGKCGLRAGCRSDTRGASAFVFVQFDHDFLKANDACAIARKLESLPWQVKHGDLKDSESFQIGLQRRNDEVCLESKCIVYVLPACLLTCKAQIIPR